MLVSPSSLIFMLKMKVIHAYEVSISVLIHVHIHTQRHIEKGDMVSESQE